MCVRAIDFHSVLYVCVRDIDFTSVLYVCVRAIDFTSVLYVCVRAIDFPSVLYMYVRAIDFPSVLYMCVRAIDFPSVLYICVLGLSTFPLFLPFSDWISELFRKCGILCYFFHFITYLLNLYHGNKTNGYFPMRIFSRLNHFQYICVGVIKHV
jgi:hypothetical protein